MSNTIEQASAEAFKRYDGDRIVDERTGEEVSHDDWGYAESERQAFIAGVEWIAAERDGLAAVIEEARAEVGDLERSGWLRDTVAGGRLAAILNRAPSNVLAEHDARIRAEVIDWIEAMGDGGSVYREAREHFGLTQGADRG